MQSASSLTFPGSRSLAQWWRQLEACRPAALWVGYTFLHRLEAPVAVSSTCRLEPLPEHVLRALNLGSTDACTEAGECLPRLHERLHLPLAALQQLLLSLERDGLVETLAQGGWAVTPRGRTALQRREYAVLRQERRIFAFAERPATDGQRRLPPHFVPLAECPGATWLDATQSFQPGWLAECIQETPAWKSSFRFPVDVQRFEATSAAGNWQQVLVDRPERVLLALVMGSVGELLGFAGRTEGWALTEGAILRLSGAAASTVWPEVATEPAPQLLRQAWVGWCRQRNIPDAEAEACQLNYRRDCVEIAAPERLVHRLRSTKSDILKGDAWVLLGDGYIRQALALRLQTPARADAH